jgi:hypothetical protein
MPEHLEKALAEASPGFERVERAGRWSLIAIVVGGILATLPNVGGPWYAPARLGGSEPKLQPVPRRRSRTS